MLPKKRRDIREFQSKEKPVLLQQQFDPALIAAAGQISDVEYVAKSDRGSLKKFDFFPGFNSAAALSLNVGVSLSVGGISVVEFATLGMYAIRSQFGKDKEWLIKAKANEAQTIQFQLDGSNDTATQVAALIGTYTTPSHENFIKNYFHLGFKIGLKRKTYVMDVPIATPVGTLEITNTLPRNQGNIIGIGISNAADLVASYTDLTAQFLTVSINGVTIIENVNGVYYNIASGRDNYLQPIFIPQGSEFQLFNRVGTPATTRVLYSVTFFFDN